MKIVQNSYAGTLESSDVFVQIVQSDKEAIQIELESSVEEIYGDDIRELIRKCVQKMGLTNVYLKVQDKGALDFVIEARVQTAILRACKSNVTDWSMI